jgi:hypothetical protein
MIARLQRRFLEDRLFRTLVVCGVLVLLTWLDERCAVHARQAAVFSFIVSALQWLGAAAGAAAAAIASGLAAVVSWLVGAVGWLAGQVAHILISTGAIFAKVWEGLKGLYTRVLRPLALWVDDHIRRFKGWLDRTFKPVFEFLKNVRDHIDAFYKRFVRPILDTIEFIRALNRVLLVFHIDFLKKLDATLQKIEQRLEDPFLWIYAKLTWLQNMVDSIVTAGGLFQRYILIQSLARDLGIAWRMFFNARAGALTAAERQQLKLRNRPKTPEQVRDEFEVYLATTGGAISERIDAARMNERLVGPIE